MAEKRTLKTASTTWRGRIESHETLSHDSFDSLGYDPRGSAGLDRVVVFGVGLKVTDVLHRPGREVVQRMYRMPTREQLVR